MLWMTILKKLSKGLMMPIRDALLSDILSLTMLQADLLRSLREQPVDT